jgi:hypothetical protein
MPNIHLELPHGLGVEEARRRVDHLIADTRREFGHMITELEESWSGHTDTFRFRVMGFAVNGTIEAQDAAVVIDMHIPLAALPLKSKVESKLRQHASELLA